MSVFGEKTAKQVYCEYAYEYVDKTFINLGKYCSLSMLVNKGIFRFDAKSTKLLLNFQKHILCNKSAKEMPTFSDLQAQHLPLPYGKIKGAFTILRNDLHGNKSML